MAVSVLFLVLAVPLAGLWSVIASEWAFILDIPCASTCGSLSCSSIIDIPLMKLYS